MSDFNSYIKKKYDQEVQPQYSDEAWDKFAAFAKIEPAKKDRKWLILLLGSLLIISILSMKYFMSTEADDSVDKSSEFYQDDIEKSSIANIGNSEIHDVDITIAELNNNEVVHDIIPSHDNEVLNNENNPNLVLGTANELSEISEAENDQVNIFTNVDSNPQIENQKPLVEADNKGDAIAVNEAERMIEVTSFLPQKMLYLEALSQPELESRIIIPVHEMNSQTGWVAGVAIGTGNLYHRSINDNGSFLLSGSLMYKVNKFLRIKTMFGFQHSSYSSKVLNRNLGLRSINYPDREARLDRVLSTTTYAEAGLGIDYISPEVKGFKIFAGPSVVYLKELSRNLDYEFDQGEIDLESITIELQELQSHPLNLMLNLGLSYQVNNDLSMSIKGEYLKVLKDSEVQLPKQIRYKLGVEKKF